MKRICIILLSCCIPFMSMADTPTISVSGVILNEKTNETVQFANIAVYDKNGDEVYIDGYKIGTTSGKDGVFTIPKCPSDAQLKISFIGYNTQVIAPQENMIVKLQPKATNIDAVEISEDRCIKDTPCKDEENHILAGKWGDRINNECVCIPTHCSDENYKIIDNKCVYVSPLDNTEINVPIPPIPFSFDELDITLSLYFDKSDAWTNDEGKFNTARLISDSVAGVVLGTIGGVVTSKVIKNTQVKNGFDDLKCTIGGQNVATYGDVFTVGVK